ncbi:terminase small subunit [Inquilinus sp.]|uniref:terminase small subunit n=1 Tax=Inquilinus sp. TaxID=1932117 RepID=UPI0031E231E0
MALTPKERRFIDEYLVDLNGAQAAIRAGYSERRAKQTASELLDKPEVAAAIEAAQAARSERTQVTQDWVLDRLQEVVERSMQHEAVTDRQGNPTGEYTFNAGGANKALELLGKHLGMFRDRVEHSGPGGGPIPFRTIRRTIVDPKAEE